jgi:hypothetical protein
VIDVAGRAGDNVLHALAIMLLRSGERMVRC